MARPLDELREACRTGRDGTSIDDLESVARELGLQAEQLLVPADFLALPEAACTPCVLVVVRPGGACHFVTLWRCQGGRAQLMDPATGRRWPSVSSLAREVYRHRAVVPAGAWQAWAESDGLQLPLAARLAALGVGAPDRQALLRRVRAGAGWLPLAALDAGVRFTGQLAAGGGVRRGRDAARLLRLVVESAMQRRGDEQAPAVLPAACWAVRALPGAADGGERLLFEGAVLVRIRGAPPASRSFGTRRAMAPRGCRRRGATAPSPATLRPAADLPGQSAAASRVAILVAASVVAAVGRFVEPALFAAALVLLPAAGAPRLRLGALAALGTVAAAVLLLELAAAQAGLALGRRGETGLRLRLAAKLPRLPDRYLRTRLLSDLAERAHLLGQVRRGPELAATGLRAGLEALLAAAGIAWLDRHLAGLALATAGGALLGALLLLPRFEERSRRVRAHTAALGGLCLDVLRGRGAVGAHGAALALRRRHDELLAGWHQARRAALAAGARFETAAQAVAALAAAGLVLAHIERHGLTPRVLLLVLWVFQLLGAARRLAVLAATELPAHRSLRRRIDEPLTAREESDALVAGGGPAADGGAVAHQPLLAGEPGRRRASPPRGVALGFDQVGVEVDGHWLLRHLDLAIPPGQHVALLGASGAGKTTLLGALLGWHRVAAGSLRIDGRRLDCGGLAELRRATAWAAPEVHLWDQSLLANLRAAVAGEPHREGTTAERQDSSGRSSPGLAPAEALRAALLLDLVPQLSQGLQTGVGEAGTRLSGGEAQRLRFARALAQPGARLALLDEPFRGLAADQRRQLLAQARAHWRGATLLCVTHSPGEALGFDRVLILERGRLREDGTPQSLAACGTSRFHALLAAEARGAAALGGAGWRHLRLAGGQLEERAKPTGPTAPDPAVGVRQTLWAATAPFARRAPPELCR